MNKAMRQAAHTDGKKAGFFRHSGLPPEETRSVRPRSSGTVSTLPRAKPVDIGSMSKEDRERFDIKLTQGVEHTRFGHMGDEEFRAEGGMEEWAEFLAEHEFYDIPAREVALINERAKESAKVLVDSGITAVTIVSRGPGTMFAEKEGQLIKAFVEAGIEIKKVVLIDASLDALNHSAKAAKELLAEIAPETKPKITKVQGDIFDPTTKSKYKLAQDTVEIGTMFGVTAMNAEGGANGMPPKTSIKDNIKGVFDQMRPGGHLISPYDHRDNAAQNEMAYGGQEKFAKNMFTARFGWSMKQMKDIQFSVKYHPQSGILAHMLEFTKKRTLDLVTGPLTIPAGLRLHFNSSIKFSKKATEEVHQEIGFEYAMPVKTKQDFGWHHMVKPANNGQAPKMAA